MATLSKLPNDIVIEDKGSSKTVSFTVFDSVDKKKLLFSAGIDANTEGLATDMLLATLKANDIGYDEITRKTKWQ